MEKTVGNLCPRCRKNSMNVYYPDDSDVTLGAWCENCNSKYVYIEGKQVPMAE